MDIRQQHRVQTFAKKNNLLEKAPEICKEWDFEKNKQLRPEDCSAGSSRKVWWICPNSHSYYAGIGSRVHNGSGCPYCANLKVLIGYNDLQSKCPEITTEWIEEKNQPLTPNNVVFTSQKKAWWRCNKCGFEWQAKIYARVGRGTGCPECAKAIRGNHRTSSASENNNLLLSFPEIANEWDYSRNGSMRPENYPSFSYKKVWWICSEGHEWEAKISLRTASKQGCPYCSGRYAIPGQNDLQTLFPEIAKEWHPSLNGELRTDMVKPGSNKKVWWLSDCGHSFQTQVYKRTKDNTGCPYCAHRKVLPGFNDLQTLLPEIAKEWNMEKNNGILPSDVLPSTSKKYWWKCSKCGYEWETSPNNRKNCPNCSSKITTSFPEQTVLFYLRKAFPDTINQHYTFNIELDIYIDEIKTAVEYDGVYYHNKSFKENKDNQKDLICKEHGIRLIRIRDPKLPKTSYAEIIWIDDLNYNSNLKQAVEQLFQLLQTKTPDIDIERDRPEILSQFQKTQFEKSLAFRFPEIAKEWNYDKNQYLSPENVNAGSSTTKVWWKCSKGHEWQAIVSNRTGKKCGCPICSGKKVLAGYNDLQTVNPELAAEWNYEKNGNLLPSGVTAKSNKKVWWKCGKCGYEWEAAVSNRSVGRGCSSCSKKRKNK